MHACPVSAARVAVALSRESKRVVNDLQQGESSRGERQTTTQVTDAPDDLLSLLYY